MEKSNMLGEIQALGIVGIDLIEHGENEQAAEAFSHAIKQLSGCMLLPTPIGGMNEEPENRVDVMFHEDEEDDEEPRSDFYPHPFLFECTASRKLSEPSLTSEQYNTCAITCLFNLAVCFHLEWEERKVDTYLLQKALTFYEQAFALTSSSALSPRDPVLKVLLAVCTNATHIHNEMVNFAEAQRWNRILKDLLEFADDEDLVAAEGYFALHAFANGFGRIAAQAA